LVALAIVSFERKIVFKLKETASMPRMIERIAHPANLETACKKGLYPQTKREEKAPGHPYSR
ncbi:hypothetical protein, partial [Faecalibaculum rodentium]|uniref:hypothetical protein n=1 Tax=Faecalibaculum rodentium TaxID=1702221 RepID=UPI0025AC5760